MTGKFDRFRCYEPLRSRAHLEAEIAHNEAHDLLVTFDRLTDQRRKGGKQAKEWHGLREQALDLLIRAKVPPAVTALFSALLGNVLPRSMDAANRMAAERDAALAQANGGKVQEIIEAYSAARKCNNDRAPDWQRSPMSGDHRREVQRLRRDPEFLALVERLRRQANE